MLQLEILRQQKVPSHFGTTLAQRWLGDCAHHDDVAFDVGVPVTMYCFSFLNFEIVSGLRCNVSISICGGVRASHCPSAMSRSTV
jgi:hypothetical protein